MSEAPIQVNAGLAAGAAIANDQSQMTKPAKGVGG
jgi:hypothetical protein